MKTIKYGLWKVINEEKIYVGERVYLMCQCDCGTIKKVIIKNLKSGVSQSCGCIRSKNLIERNTKHNKRHTKIWRIWQAMKNRCYNKNFTQYERYGGRGIKVCDSWKNEFISFYKDMGNPPVGKTLDRIDNNGNYEPSNCKWSTPREQMRNKSSNHKINGICITDISKSLGGGHALVGKRLKRGWSVEMATTLKTNANL
ncbi:MAG: hypothetical protein WCO06_01470 [Candidatus Roizmanbacteria bacterium]